MNWQTNIKNQLKVTKREIELGIESASWHQRYSHSAYVFVGGLSYDLTEGDLLAVFSQYGELVDVNLVRDDKTKQSRGFAFLAYEDQRSTILAVDNLTGARIDGRVIRVEHVENYKRKKEEMEGGKAAPDEGPKTVAARQIDAGLPSSPTNRLGLTPVGEEAVLRHEIRTEPDSEGPEQQHGNAPATLGAKGIDHNLPIQDAMAQALRERLKRSKAEELQQKGKGHKQRDQQQARPPPEPPNPNLSTFADLAKRLEERGGIVPLAKSKKKHKERNREVDKGNRKKKRKRDRYSSSD